MNEEEKREAKEELAAALELAEEMVMPMLRMAEVMIPKMASIMGKYRDALMKEGFDRGEATQIVSRQNPVSSK